jgi:hypothetical protein
LPSFKGSLIKFYVKSKNREFFIFFDIFDRLEMNEAYWRVIWINQDSFIDKRFGDERFNFDENDKLINQIQDWIDYC